MGVGAKRSKPVTGDRFDIREKLGSGGMGAVYRAFDRDRKIEVALKTLLRAEPRALYRFKREFRALADVVHPNLVDLYELYTVGDEWFFTMELVEGISFVSHVRPFDEPLLARGPDGAESATSATVTDTGETRTTDVWHRLPPPRERVLRGKLDMDRLCQALPQLVDGVTALHRAGKLHRDLKPSNVLVEPDGRVVLLDFGLTSDVMRMDEDRTHDDLAVGTPLYMSPEQAADVPLTEASDWYSIGVMLYEALTGRRPFEGLGEEIYVAKQLRDPEPPRALAPSVPEFLDELCMKLLIRDPRKRPSGPEILARLDQQPSSATLQLDRAVGRAPFVGRQEELGQLRSALEDSRLGGSVAVFVRGSSGMGKSALVRRFLDEVATSSRAVVLEGRCYERESVPYKALDAVVDALTRYLLSVPTDQIDELLPRGIMALARLFPVLRRVPAIAEPKRRGFEPPDPHELRRRAFAALRHLLKQLALRRPVVIYIDDLQWGDVDSASFLTDLIYHPAPPAVLLIVSYRTEDEEASPLIRSLRRERPASAGGEVRELDVGALDRDEAAALVREIAGSGDGEEPLSEALYRSAAGNPLFLVELARMRASWTEAGGAGTPTLDQLLRLRIEGLPPRQRKLLEACAVAGRPVAAELVVDAAGERGEAGGLSALRAENLIRSRVAEGGSSRIEPYHDRVREVVLAGLSDAERAELHRKLALAHERRGHADPAILVQHWWVAGDMARVGRFAEQAAEAALEALAFNRAAELFRLAIAHGDHSEGGERALNEKLGHALTNAGRLTEAADAYAAASEGAPAAEALELARLEMEQRLRAGDLERGTAKASEVLAAVDLSLPPVGRRAILTVLRQRVLLRLRGFDFEERERDQIPPRELRRLEICWSTASSFTLVNPLVGRALQMKFLRLALAAGDPAHVGLAMALEAGYRAIAGTRSRDQVESMRERALALAHRLNDRRLEGLIEGTCGVSSFLAGEWREALERLGHGERILRDHATDVRWEIDITQFFTAGALVYAGELAELARVIPLYLREAEERGDVYAVRGLRCWRGSLLWLVQDRADEVAAFVGSLDVPSPDGFHLQHYYELTTLVQAALYSGCADDAHRLVNEQWRALKRSMLMRIQSVKIEASHLRARTALAVDSGDGGLAEAERATAVLEREDAPWSRAVGALARAGLHARRGDEDSAVVSLWDAIDRFEDAGMAMHAACARWRLGRLVAGAEGERLAREASDWMSAQRVEDPERLVALFAPGFD